MRDPTVQPKLTRCQIRMKSFLKIPAAYVDFLMAQYPCPCNEKLAKAQKKFGRMIKSSSLWDPKSDKFYKVYYWKKNIMKKAYQIFDRGKYVHLRVVSFYRYILFGPIKNNPTHNMF